MPYSEFSKLGLDRAEAPTALVVISPAIHPAGLFAEAPLSSHRGASVFRALSAGQRSCAKSQLIIRKIFEV